MIKITQFINKDKKLKIIIIKLIKVEVFAEYEK